MPLDSPQVDITFMAVDALEFWHLGAKLLVDTHPQGIQGVGQNSILERFEPLISLRPCTCLRLSYQHGRVVSSNSAAFNVVEAVLLAEVVVEMLHHELVVGAELDGELGNEEDALLAGGLLGHGGGRQGSGQDEAEGSDELHGESLLGNDFAVILRVDLFCSPFKC